MNNLITTVKYFKLDNQQDKCLADCFLNMDLYIFRNILTDTFLICQEPSLPKTNFIICNGSNKVDMIIAIIEKNKNAKSILKNYIEYLNDKEVYIDNDINNISPILLDKYTIDYLDNFCEEFINPNIERFNKKREDILSYQGKTKIVEEKSKYTYPNTTNTKNYVDYGKWLSEQRHETLNNDLLNRMSSFYNSSGPLNNDLSKSDGLDSYLSQKKELLKSTPKKKENTIIDKIKKVFSNTDDDNDEIEF